MPPPEDDSPAAQFRRDVLELAQELEVAHRKDGSAAGAPTFGAPEPPENLDMRGSTPFLLIRARRALRHRLEAKPRGGKGGELSGMGGGDGRALVLLEIGRSNGVLPRKIAQSVGIRMTSLSRIVKRAERDGLVLRRPHHHDGRTWLFELTPEGRRVAAGAAARIREADQAILGRLRPDERDELRRLLRRAARALA